METLSSDTLKYQLKQKIMKTGLTYQMSINNFPASGDFCSLQITHAIILDPDQDRQNTSESSHVAYQIKGN